MIDNKNILLKLINEFVPYAKNRLGLKRVCKICLKKDHNNAQDPLGKTAYYDIENNKITIFISKRHPKDILRSLSHELVHFSQAERGNFNNKIQTENGYAQNDEFLREMEKEAYLKGNLIFRDFEDKRKEKNQVQESIYTTENNIMTTGKIKLNDIRKELFESRNMRLMGQLFSKQGLVINELEMSAKEEIDDVDESCDEIEEKTTTEQDLPPLGSDVVEKSIRRKDKRIKRKEKSNIPTPELTEKSTRKKQKSNIPSGLTKEQLERIKEIVKAFLDQNSNKILNKESFIKNLFETLKKKELI